VAWGCSSFGMEEVEPLLLNKREESGTISSKVDVEIV